MHDWVFFHADRAPDRAAVLTPSLCLSYRELADRIRLLAGLLAASGIRQGDRVMLALPNTPATVVAALAVNAIGATSVEVSRTWSPEVLADIVARSGVRHAFVWERDAPTWIKVLAERPIERLWQVHPGTPSSRDRNRVIAGVPATAVLEDGRVDPDPGAVSPPPVPELSVDQPALILYTSGSTGRPRGVVQTFRNVDANTRSIVESLSITSEDRALLTLPLSYCYGRSVLQTHLFAGGSVLLDNRFALPRVVLEVLAAESCTSFAGVPLTFEILRRQVDVSSMEFPNLRYVTQAGGAMAPETIAWTRSAFEPAQLFIMYGQTEATARLSCLSPEQAIHKAGSIGIPIPGVELRVVDPAGVEVPTGEVGELVARGENVTLGYLDEPDETAAILHDGWLWTGDLASRDEDGFLFHRGRVKEILKIGGHRVSPIEIEQVIMQHPHVAEAGVCGVADDLMGEKPVAFVVCRPGQSFDEKTLVRFCRERLAAFKVPARFLVADSLPRNESGKLLRAELARRVTSADGVATSDSGSQPQDLLVPAPGRRD